MQALAEFCIRRPVFATMLIMALVVVGIAALVGLGVDRFPAVDLPQVTVRTSLPGGTPEEVESEITERIEEVMNTVDGIEELRSVTGAGSCFVSATFKLSRNIDAAAQDVRDRINTILRDLPDDTDPPTVSKFDNDSQPVITLALSGTREVRELTELADKIIKRQLERSAGVGEVRIVGGLERTMNIWLSADRLAAYKLPAPSVRDAIARQNTNVPAGNVTGDQQEQVVRTVGRLATERQFNDLIIARLNGVPIHVRDVGYARDAEQEQRSLARLDGEPTVILEVQRQSGANTVAVIEAVKENLARVIGQLPPDVRIEIIRDQSRYIYSALHEINVHLVAGSVLACLVVLVFVGSWRSTVIAAVAIPTSLIGTFGVMWAFGFTLNGVTMLALVLMVGIVIDDAIVVLENVYRFVEEKGLSPVEAAKQGTAEIGSAVLATTLSLAVIFVPVSFMSSISGRFLYQFGITAAAAVMISLLVSFTLTPMMCSRLLKPPKRRPAKAAPGSTSLPPREGQGEGPSAESSGDTASPAAPHSAAVVLPDEHGSASSRRGFYRYVDLLYTLMLRLAMKLRWGIALLAIAVVATSWPLYNMVKQEFIPSDVDEAEFDVRISGPEGASLKAMDDVMRQIEADVASVKGVTMVQANIGGNFLGNTNAGGLYVRIEPHDERVFSVERLIRETLHGHPPAAWKDNYSQRDVMQQVRQKLRKYATSHRLRASVRNYESFRIGGGNFDIDFVLRGPDLFELSAYAERLRDMTRDAVGVPGSDAAPIPGIVDADTTLKLDKPELRVHINRDRAADMGIDARDLGTALRLMIGGDQEVSRFRDPKLDEDYDVRLRLIEADRSDPTLLESLYVPRIGGEPVQIASVAEVEWGRTPSRIDRLDRQRSVNLRAGVAPGYAQADRIEALRAAVADMNLPPAYTTRVTGKARELERTFTEFLWAFLLSVVFMYMILAAQYESFIHPVTILLSLPLTVPFALFSLWFTDSTLNLYSALGILVLFGVVKKNSILQIDHMNQLRRKGMPRHEAIIEGNRDRLRPILMTTLTLVAGMLPLLLGAGPGAEERYTIAIVIIGGQSLSLLLTLLVTPVAYSIFDDVQSLLLRVKGRVSRSHIAAPPPAPASAT